MGWKRGVGYQRKIKDGGFTLRQYIKNFVQDINGLTLLEKNIINFMKIGRDKKAIKFAKKRLGSMKRAKKKVDFLNNISRFT